MWLEDGAVLKWHIDRLPVGRFYHRRVNLDHQRYRTLG